MKYLIYTILLFISILSCKAQSPIVDIDAPRSSTIDGAYFKDINNEFNKFTGTWFFTEGSTSITFEIKKVEMIFNGTDYEDKLVGEYKYVSNGLIVVNTLANIYNQNSAQNNINGRRLIENDQSIICNDCSPNERRVELTFYDRDRLYLSPSIILRYLFNETNPEKMTATLYLKSSSLLPYEGAPTSPRVPYGTYLMEKQ
ncbi:hypothetical protein ES692_08755 [Psychroserpens burtonensis]|uniref:DUF6705 domain-containing protein n=1 Tax=Psychroserpens burtonensis TaxID=49278 RepID=A0A5C7B7N3_9FLAO|nr:DUF6705 family protein [Psychroserpens burtonensis]TXE17644.1 hypothetical protein ES692_08755 [Psychroserpens burtonensis]